MKNRFIKYFAILSLFGVSLTGCGVNAEEENSHNISDTNQYTTLKEIYDVAVRNGYEGTYEEWIESLKGEPGASLHTGYGSPSKKTGNNGDTYLDLNSYNLYTKEDNEWVYAGNIKGPQGKPGQNGSNGKDGEDGEDGVDSSTNDTGLIFYTLSDNECAVGVGTSQYFEGEITIPSEYNDRRVTRIVASGFKNSSLTSIVIPNSITYIGEHAFEGCYALTSIELPSSVTTIQEKAFANCESLSSISLGSVRYIGEWAFGNCPSLVSVNIPSSVYQLRDGVFYNCNNLTTVNYLSTKNSWNYIDLRNYIFTGTQVTSINCTDGSININQFNTDILKSLDYTYHAVGGYVDSWAPAKNNEMEATSIRHVYELDANLGSKLSEKQIENLYIRQISVGNELADWSTKTFYKNKVRDVNGAYAIRISQATYNPIEDEYLENQFIPDYGNFTERNRAEALTNNIFIPSYQSEIDDNGFNWNNLPILNVRPGTYILVMAKYANSYYNTPSYGLGLIVVNGGDMIINDPLEEPDPEPGEVREYTGIYLNEDDSQFATTTGDSLQELSEYSASTPVKAPEGSVQYGFCGWELISNINNVATFKAKFEACTRGLVFEGNAVYQYTGLTKEVEIPSVWNGHRITTISDRAFQGSEVTSVSLPDSIVEIQGYAFAACKDLTDIEIPSNVTSIGSYAFTNCDSLTSITIPDSVTTIGSYCFSDCNKLDEVHLSHNITYIPYNCFSNCPALTSINIPNRVTNIEGNAFYQCYNLTSINIPDSVVSIGSYAFENCNKLNNVSFGANLRTIYYDAFYGCYSLKQIVIPEHITSIGDNAFGNCGDLVIYMTLEYKPKDFSQNWNGDSTVVLGYVDTVEEDGYTYVLYQREDYKYAQVIDYDKANIKHFEVPEEINGYTVTSINTKLFYDNDVIESVVLPNSITSIESNMFFNCESLKSVTIPESVTTIGVAAFSSCVALESIDIPNSVTSIGNSAFYNCASLESINIPNGVTSIGDNTFYGCASLTSIVIPDGVTSIGSSAFSSCTSLISVVLPDTIEVINEYAFENCTSLEAINMPNNLVTIGRHAFYNCSSITSITLPDTVETIGYQAFYNCTSLSSFRMSSNIKTIDGYAVSNTAITYTLYGNGKYVGNENNEYLVLTDRYNGHTVTEIHDGCEVMTTYALQNNDNTISIVLPNSLRVIGRSAFTNNNALKTVYFKGTEAEWAQITIMSGNEYLNGAKKYFYSEEEPTSSGNYWHYVDDVPTIW